MKRGAPDHPKMRRLARRLGLPHMAAVGCMEMLWHWTARYAQDGAVGRYCDDDIADALHWTNPAERLITALVESGFVDRDETHRLVLHGWSEHCEDAVHMSLARARLRFADGSAPNLSRLGGDEKENAEAFYKVTKRKSVRTPCAQKRTKTHAVRTPCAQKRTKTHAVRTALASYPDPDPDPDSSLRSEGETTEEDPEKATLAALAPEKDRSLRSRPAEPGATADPLAADSPQAGASPEPASTAEPPRSAAAASPPEPPAPEPWLWLAPLLLARGARASPPPLADEAEAWLEELWLEIEAAAEAEACAAHAESDPTAREISARIKRIAHARWGAYLASDRRHRGAAAKRAKDAARARYIASLGAEAELHERAYAKRMAEVKEASRATAYTH